MSIEFSVTRSAPRDSKAIGIGVFTEGAVGRALGIDRAGLTALGFDGKPGQACVIAGGNGATRVALGLGTKGETTVADVRKASGAFVRVAGRLGSLATGIVETAGVDPKAGAQAAVEGASLGSYSFAKFKSDAPKKSVESFTLVTPESAVKSTQAGVDRGTAIAQAVAMARDLINTPGGSLNARDIAEVALQVAKESGLEVEVMDEAAMEKAGMGGMLGVNKGSDEPPRLIKMTYSPRNPTGSVALVGKGITFDSGGLSLKSGEGMMSMKIDMSGAAAVLATMSALKATKPKVKVVAFLCCTDNMPSGTALKPGDVITIRNGKTVEVLNTDAEGRLVLADGLSLAVEENVDAIVDLATLTGAVVAALGNRIAGVMGNDDDWMSQVRSAAARADENVWPLPLPTEYRRFLDSPVADMKNIGGTSVLGSGGGGGGALDRGPVPEGVRRRHALGAHRPRGPRDGRRRRQLREPRRHGIRRAHPRRAARPLLQALKAGARPNLSRRGRVAPLTRQVRLGVDRVRRPGRTSVDRQRRGRPTDDRQAASGVNVRLACSRAAHWAAAWQTSGAKRHRPSWACTASVLSPSCTRVSARCRARRAAASGVSRAGSGHVEWSACSRVGSRSSWRAFSGGSRRLTASCAPFGCARPNWQARTSVRANGELRLPSPPWPPMPSARAVSIRSSVKPSGDRSSPAASRRMSHVVLGPITPSQKSST